MDGGLEYEKPNMLRIKIPGFQTELKWLATSRLQIEKRSPKGIGTASN